jgi:predicted Zn-dependent protease with MMP-like domain
MAHEVADSAAVAPTLETIEGLAAAAYRTIPLKLRKHVEGVVIRVVEFPDDETVDAMGIDSPFDLMGLYRGVSLDRKSVNDPAPQPDMIFLYRRPLLDYWCETGEELGHLIRHVLIHEIGHHFGFSDADMEAIEAEEA